EVTGLTKVYDSFAAVKDFSFAVKRGEVLGLVGPNGAGKTTTLRALAGIHPPTEGHIKICGADLRDDPVEAKRHLAFMPDEPRLFDYGTVDELKWKIAHGRGDVSLEEAFLRITTEEKASA